MLPIPALRRGLTLALAASAWGGSTQPGTVSYTHLTLPTIYSV